MFKTGITLFVFMALIFLGCDSNPVAPSEKLGPIVFSANRTSDRINGKTQLYTMEPDGSNLIQLTDDNFSRGGPRWSPDGKTIAFQSNKGRTPDAFPLYLMDANRKNERLLAPQGSQAVWSPDGKQMAYSKDPRCGGVCGNWDTFILNLADKTERSLNSSPNYYESVSDWSPDGRLLLIESNNPKDNPGEDWEIYTMEMDGNYVARLTDNDVWDVSPRWSPDGSMIVYSAFDGKDWDIFIMDTDGSNKRNLSNDDYLFSSSPCWSPDGTKILYTVTDGTEQQQRDLDVINIYSINIDGTGLTKLTQRDFINQSPDWR